VAALLAFRDSVADTFASVVSAEDACLAVVVAGKQLEPQGPKPRFAEVVACALELPWRHLDYVAEQGNLDGLQVVCHSSFDAGVEEGFVGESCLVVLQSAQPAASWGLMTDVDRGEPCLDVAPEQLAAEDLRRVASVVEN
jgi:hypothetical protein